MLVADLLLVTNQRATEVDGVIDRCRMHGLSIERINLCQYPESSRFSWSPIGESSSPTENLADVFSAKAAWFHDPGRYTIAHSLDGHARELAMRDCDGFWDGVTYGSDATWLNSPQALATSSRKLLQLSLARSFGIPTPETLVSNDAEQVRAFFGGHGGAIAKSIANGYSVYGEEKLKLYSRFFRNPPDDLLSGLVYSPIIFQERVAKRREMRVTIVDDRCFGMVTETADLDEQHVDVRRLDYCTEKERFSGILVPGPVEEASRKLMRSFRLSYAGLDWIEDHAGHWFFLELNCMGSFKWSELCGAGDITGAISEALIDRAMKVD